MLLDGIYINKIGKEIPDELFGLTFSKIRRIKVGIFDGKEFIVCTQDVNTRKRETLCLGAKKSINLTYGRLRHPVTTTMLLCKEYKDQLEFT